MIEIGVIFFIKFIYIKIIIGRIIDIIIIIGIFAMYVSTLVFTIRFEVVAYFIA